MKIADWKLFCRAGLMATIGIGGTSVLAESPQDTKDIKNSLYKHVVTPRLNDLEQAADDVDANGTASRFQIKFSDKKNEVTVETGEAFKSFNGNYFNASATFPVNKSNNSLAIESLDALSNKARVGLTWQKVALPALDRSSDVLRKKLLVCKDYLESYPEVHSESRNRILDFDIGLLDPLRSMDVQAQTRWLDSGLQPAQFDALEDAVDTCNAGYVDEDPKFANRFYESLLEDNSRQWLYGVNLTVAHSNNTYFESAQSLESKVSESALDSSAKVYVGSLMSASSYLGFSATYQNSHKPNSASTICEPLEGSALTDCRSVVIGEPVQSESTVLAFKYVKKFKNYGAQIELSRNLDKDVSGLSLPIWRLAPFGDVNVGFRLNWDSEDKELGAGIFFNTPLNLGP